MRLFIGIPLYDAALPLKHIQKTLQSFNTLKNVKEHQFHLTIKFFGNLKKDDAQKVMDTFSAWKTQCTQYNAFDVRISGLGAFPGLSRPSVIWAGLHDNTDTLQEIYADCQKLFDSAGFEIDRRNFHAHLTLARVKKTATVSEKLIEFISEHKDYPFSSLQVQSIVLYESRLHSSGPEYFKINEIMLT